MRLLPSPAGVEVPLIEGVKNCVNRLSGTLSALYRYRDIGGISGGFTRIDGGVCVVVKEFGTSEGDIPVAFVAAGRWVFPEVSFKECRDSVDGRSCSGAGDGYCNFGITSLTLTAKPAPNPGTSDAVTAAVILGIAAAAGIALISEKHRS